VIRQLVSNRPADKFSSTILCIDGQIGEIGQQVRAQGTNVLSVKRSPGLDFSVVRMIRKTIRETGADVVRCHQYTPWVYGWLGSLGTDANVVFTEHGRFHSDRYHYKAMLINPLMARLTGGVIAISHATRKALARYEFVPASKIQVIYNRICGLERDNHAVSAVRRELGIPEGDRVIGTVVRLDQVKNQSMMLRAFAQVVSQHPDSWLLMVGDGPSRQNLEHLANTLGITDRVIFTGFRPEPAGYFAAMDIFLLTSHTEGPSMTLLEAISLDIPAITTAVGGNPEIIRDGETGILVSTDSPKELTTAINALRENESLRFSMGKASKRRFDGRFSVTLMVSGYQALYQQLIRG
jgi:glycosyltransferase involved in cell wall biosynthesis